MDDILVDVLLSRYFTHALALFLASSILFVRAAWVRAPVPVKSWVMGPLPPGGDESIILPLGSLGM